MTRRRHGAGTPGDTGRCQIKGSLSSSIHSHFRLVINSLRHVWRASLVDLSMHIGEPETGSYLHGVIFMGGGLPDLANKNTES